MQIIKQRRAQPDSWPREVVTATDQIEDWSISDRIVLDALLVDEANPLIAARLSQQSTLTGIVLLPEPGCESMLTGLSKLGLIKIPFVGFADGRGYSFAVQLRQQHGYKGELRATGVERDNLLLLEQCGFDAFEVTEDTTLESALSAFDELTLPYGKAS